MNLFPFSLAISMKNYGKELLKDDALWAIIFGALSLLVLFN
ncbi:hypothetical protein [Prochlorococcus marinus]|nr:hypothetical protein [Prochlorococcus marinus]